MSFEEPCARDVGRFYYFRRRVGKNCSWTTTMFSLAACPLLNPRDFLFWCNSLNLSSLRSSLVQCVCKLPHILFFDCVNFSPFERLMTAWHSFWTALLSLGHSFMYFLLLSSLVTFKASLRSECRIWAFSISYLGSSLRNVIILFLSIHTSLYFYFCLDLPYCCEKSAE